MSLYGCNNHIDTTLAVISWKYDVHWHQNQFGMEYLTRKCDRPLNDNDTFHVGMKIVSIMCRLCVDYVSIMCRLCVDYVSIMCRLCIENSGDNEIHWKMSSIDTSIPLRKCPHMSGVTTLWVNMGQIGYHSEKVSLITGCPLTWLSLEDRLYCTLALQSIFSLAFYFVCQLQYSIFFH